MKCYSKILIKSGIVTLFLVILLFICHSYVEKAWEYVIKYRKEKIVLEHFENDPNPLKYKAAKFLIDNMAYHQSYHSDDASCFDDAYVSMARNAKEYRDSVITKEMGRLAFNRLWLNKHSDILNVDADYLIKAVDDACDTWAKVNWNHEYDDSLFFNYVLPYRVFDEAFSDWHETISKEFPYLKAPIVYSQNGVPFFAFKERLIHASVIDQPSALKRKSVQLNEKGASVSFRIHSGITTQKLIRLRYSSLAKDAKAIIVVNNKTSVSVDLEPTCNIYSFRSSRFGVVLNLQKGDNEIIVKFANKPFSLDYIEVAAYEPYYDNKSIDYSKSYCQIQNVSSNKYVSFDTLQTKLRQPIELRGYSANDWTLNMRIDNLGYSIWRISSMFEVNQCLEEYRDSICTLQHIRTNTIVDSNNGDSHQKWIIIPIEGGFCKIMNKLTGLVWESSTDPKTGKEMLIQNFYSGRNTQKWRIIRHGSNPYALSFFKSGNVVSEALRVTDVMKQFEFISNRGDVSPTLSAICKYRTGICEDEASYTVALSRYLGIPTAVDFVPHWGNRPKNHMWSVIILPNEKATPFYMGFAPGDTAQYAHQYLKPKIFRYKFELNHKIHDDFRGEKSVPQLFVNPTFVDVTDEYYRTTDVRRYIPKEFRSHKIAYICVSDREFWIPVHYGKIHKGIATFKSMARNILYTIGVWKNDQIVPIGNPFIIKADGSIRNIVCDKNKKQIVRLYRKYPFFAKFNPIAGRMEFGRFMGSNNRNFSDADTLYTHRGSTDGTWLERNLNATNKTYKYLRYVGFYGSYCNVNEIAFYNSKGEKLKGKIIGTQGTDKHTKETVFDGDVLTGFNGNSPDGHWVGLELPKPSDVARIMYLPRNDGNNVEIGDNYQLLMYDNGKWVSLGWKKAKETMLVFKNIPSNGLYLLKDKTKGKEERIFTYENGKQVWW